METWDWIADSLLPNLYYTEAALEIRTKKMRAKVAPNSEKFGATLKSWGPS